VKIDRLNEMEAFIEKSGAISLQELCRYFHVSMSTVRRDIALLTSRNRIQKVYGGAAAEERQLRVLRQLESGRSEPSGRQPGELAASLVQNGMSVFLDSGAETTAVLPFLAQKKNITVISNSLGVLMQAARYPALHVIALGGIYNFGTSSFCGHRALDDLAKMSIDLVFLTADGVSLERGLTSDDYTETEVKKTVAKWNRDLVLLADASAFGRNALITFCEIARLKAIVCDRPLPKEFLRAGALHKIDLLSPETEAGFGEDAEESAPEQAYAMYR